jgi:hypothetical protein
MTVSNRTFGVEIECFLPDGMNHAACAAAISARGIDCRQEGYNHLSRTWWKVITDGSLRDNNGSVDYVHGAEVVSPKLSGADGFRQLETVMQALQDLGVTVNRFCGLHVHVGAVNDSLDFHKSLAKFYAAYESVIDSIMPKSRRGNANNYCRSIVHASREQIDATRSVTDLFNLLGRGAASSRYVKLNYQRKYGTVEFRQHSGTLDYAKASMWIRTCLAMCEKAASGIEFNQPAPVQPLTPKVRRGSKRAICVDMLLRPEGATREQLLAATGWPTISVQDVVSRTGMDLLTTRMGRRITYRLNQAAAQAHSLSAAAVHEMEISIDGLCNMIGSSAEDRDYLKRRAANLSGAHQWAA